MAEMRLQNTASVLVFQNKMNVHSSSRTRECDQCRMDLPFAISHIIGLGNKGTSNKKVLLYTINNGASGYQGTRKIEVITGAGLLEMAHRLVSNKQNFLLTGMNGVSITQDFDEFLSELRVNYKKIPLIQKMCLDKKGKTSPKSSN